MMAYCEWLGAVLSASLTFPLVAYPSSCTFKMLHFIYRHIKISMIFKCDERFIPLSQCAKEIQPPRGVAKLYAWPLVMPSYVVLLARVFH